MSDHFYDEFVKEYEDKQIDLILDRLQRLVKSKEMIEELIEKIKASHNLMTTNVLVEKRMSDIDKVVRGELGWERL